MGKIRFVAEEFFRSFHKSLFKDILLMGMFSISLFTAVLMGSYYFDLGDRYQENSQQAEGGIWYSLSLMYEGTGEISNSMTTSSGCWDMMDYYEAVTSLKEYPMISLFTDQGVYIRQNDAKSLFGDTDYRCFLGNYDETVTTGYFDGEPQAIVYLKGSQADLAAYRMFGLRVQEGKGFTEESLTLAHTSDPVPILLGNDYKGIIGTGTEIEVSYWGFVFCCKVAGILEKGAALPEGGDLGSDMHLLDSEILFPYGIKLADRPTDIREIEKFALNNYIALDNGIVRLEDKGKERELVALYKDIGQEYGIPPLHLLGMAMGIDLFRTESAASIRIMLLLAIALSNFSFLGLVLTFYHKIQSNRRTYAVYLMNGCSLGMLLLPFLLEAALILFPGISLCRAAFTSRPLDKYQTDAIMQAACILVGTAFMASAGILIFLMHGIDTEQLMRQKE